MKKRATKREMLGEILRNQIFAGKYVFGQKLPPSMKLCEELNGNYLTILTVLHDLEDEGFIECKNGVGCFVRYLPADRTAFCKKVQMIVRKDTYEAKQSDVINAVDMARRHFEAKGWEYMVCPVELSSNTLQRTINNPDAFSVIYGIQPYLGDMNANLNYVRRRVIMIGEFAAEPGIATIIADEHKMMSDAVEHLFRQGYRNPALVLCSLESPVEKIFLEGWMSACIRHRKSIQWFRNMLQSLHLEARNGRSLQIQEGADRLVKRLMDEDKLAAIDSFICPGIHWTSAIGKCLQKHGYRIPEDYGLISIAGSNNSDSAPSITYLDNNLEKHITLAVEILENRYQGNSETGTIFCTPPKLVIGESTRRKKAVHKT